MEMLTLENVRKWGSNTIVAHLPGGKTVVHEGAYNNASNIINEYLQKGYTAPQNEIGAFLNKVVKTIDFSKVSFQKNMLVMMKN